ncbi:MAG: phosphoglycerate mutase family protein [Acidobacteriota bacterium]
MSGRAWIPLFIATCLAAGPEIARAQRAVFLVRHAEKADATNDTELSAEGHARARALAHLLQDAGVTAVYTSEYRRTRQTAEPLVGLRRITITSMPARELEALVRRIRSENADDTVLVVGHSDTVPRLIAALGGPQSLSIAESEYDNLFLVVPKKDGPPTLLVLRY